LLPLSVAAAVRERARCGWRLIRCPWLRSQTNRHGRPFQQETISAYRDAAVALSSWMTPAGLEADFIKDLLSATGGGKARTFEDAATTR
jgi:hypothetical protein